MYVRVVYNCIIMNSCFFVFIEWHYYLQRERKFVLHAHTISLGNSTLRLSFFSVCVSCEFWMHGATTQGSSGQQMLYLHTQPPLKNFLRVVNWWWPCERHNFSYFSEQNLMLKKNNKDCQCAMIIKPPRVIAIMTCKRVGAIINIVK